jgi:predicted N-acetyltransferase YhbS
MSSPRSGSDNAAEARASTAALPVAGTAGGDYVWPLGVTALPIDAVQCGPGSAGDHAAIQQLLTAVFQGPSKDDFSAALEDPLYEPCDRLVVKRGSQVLSHVHLASREMQFGGDAFPVTLVYRLATLPEYRGRGFATRLLAAADAAMAEDGAVLGLLTTRAPHFLRRAGWVVCMRHSHADVGARDLLAQLSARGFAPHAADDTINIRPWRHVELPSLVRLYQEHTAKSYGPLTRTEAYWRWLVNRQGTDGIFVALAGPKRFDFDFDDAAIVGYCLQRDDRIVELVASPKHPGVKERLLARACGEAIEHDNHIVRIELAPNDPLWQAVSAAGGDVHRDEAYQGEVTMVKLFNPWEFLRRLLPAMHVRAQSAGLRRPAELGLVVGEQRLRVIATRRSVKVQKGPPGRALLKLSEADFTRLLLGHIDVPTAVADKRLKATSRAGVELATVLFPRLPLWHPPMDDLLV